MALANYLSGNPTRANIDHQYNNAGRAWERGQIVQNVGQQQLARVGNQFDQASSSSGQGLARRGLLGGSADLSQQSRLAQGLQDARAGVSGNMQSLSNQLAGQDEQARQGLSGQFNGAIASNTAAQQQLTGLAGQLSNNAKNINAGVMNGVVGAGVGAYNQYRQNNATNNANKDHQSIFQTGAPMQQSRAPTNYDYLKY
ncbi:MAG: hypothetical protein R8M45_05215 [Ghiorsea sp.]